MNLLVCLTLLLIFTPTAFAQNSDSPKKFDEFLDVSATEKLPHLDRFAAELEKDKSLKGVIIGRRHESELPGVLTRELYGYRNYLVSKRGIVSDRLSVINAGVSDRDRTELWLSPAGANPPAAEVTRFNLTEPTKFDSMSMEETCQGESFIHLYKLDDSVRFFGQALSQNPQAKAWIVIYPNDRDSVSSAHKIVSDIAGSLTKDYGVAGSRLFTHVAARRLSECRKLSFWLAPPDTTKADPKAHQAAVIKYAERNQYLVRRIEFIGNATTPDMELRRRLTINEGHAFTRASLMQSIKQLNDAKEIFPIGLDAVELYPDRDAHLVDISIYFRERPRQAKQE